jgi:3',5'-cyclic AMP phosphodiesterase CpdA
VFQLAHLSDPHLATSLNASVLKFFNKRALGYLTWRLLRSRLHRTDVLIALQDDVSRAGVDHVAITGDIVNISLAREFTSAATWLASFGSTADVTVVPGNHDAYIRSTWQKTLFAWADFMSSDDAELGPRPPAGVDDFPILRRRGPIALVGLSSAIPSGPGQAIGKLGGGQLARLAETLRRLRDDGCLRVVLLHHPPVDAGTPRQKRLIDAALFRGVIADAGAELILHGHNHAFQQAAIDGPEHPAHVFGVPSASAIRGDSTTISRYHLFRIAENGSCWQIDVRARIFDPLLRRFSEQPVCELRVPRPAPVTQAH